LLYISGTYASRSRQKVHYFHPEAYILENTPPPPGGEISANVIWGNKYEKAKRKRGKL
jgi:hypothetical protein